jgi:hypothetical protein
VSLDKYETIYRLISLSVMLLSGANCIYNFFQNFTFSIFASVACYVAIISFGLRFQLDGQEESIFNIWNEYRQLDKELDKLLYRYNIEIPKEIRHLEKRLFSYQHFIANEKEKIK